MIRNIIIKVHYVADDDLLKSGAINLDEYMICDKCKKDVGTHIQKFHKPYADYLKLNQVNGFCHECWNEIVTKNGTWLDICVKEAVQPYLLKNIHEESFTREYDAIWMSSKEDV